MNKNYIFGKEKCAIVLSHIVYEKHPKKLRKISQRLSYLNKTFKDIINSNLSREQSLKFTYLFYNDELNKIDHFCNDKELSDFVKCVYKSKFKKHLINFNEKIY